MLSQRRNQSNEEDPNPAEAYRVSQAPHCTASNLGIAASLHVAKAIPFLLIHEFYPQNPAFNPGGIMQMNWKVDDEEYVDVSGEPRLGIEVFLIHLDAKAKNRKKQSGLEQQLRDRAIADY